MEKHKKLSLWKGKMGHLSFFLLVVPVWVLTLGLFESSIEFSNHRMRLPMNPFYGKIAAKILKRMDPIKGPNDRCPRCNGWGDHWPECVYYGAWRHPS